VVASRKNDFPPVPSPGGSRLRRGARAEAARRALVEGIDRSRRLVERYRVFLAQLHDPSVAPGRRQTARLRPDAGSSG
jgi:hypothetical protein